MIHVLILPSWYSADAADPGGSFFREQALALQRAGCKVGVVAPGMCSLRRPLSALRADRGISKEVDEGLPTYRMTGINWTPRIWQATVRRIGKIGNRLYQAYVADHGRPDLIHVHASLPAGYAAKRITAQHGIPYVLSEHSTAFARGIVSAAGLRVARSVAEGAAARFAVSTPFARLLENRLSLAKQSFAVMPNMVNLSFLNVPLVPPGIGRTRFLHVSLLDAKKRVDLILRAFALRFHKDQDVCLTIGGDGPTRGALQALARELGIADRVRFPGRLSRVQVREAMSECDAFVLSSRFETFGVVLVEALAMGRPVIATRCGGPEDIVTRDTGILVPTDDIDALADAMARVHESRTSWPAEKLRAHCAAQFGPDVVSARWKEIYQTLLAAGGARG